MTHTVVVTGLGAVSPYGAGVQPLWEGLLAARPTAAPVRDIATEGLPVRFACQVSGFDTSAHLPRKLARQLDPFAQYAAVAAEEALDQAGLLAGPDADEPAALRGADPERVGVVLSTGLGSVQELLAQQTALAEQGPSRVRPYLAVIWPPNMAAGQVAIRHGLQGPSSAVASACASGGDAVGAGRDLIAAGRADVAVVGGAEAPVSRLALAAFAAAGALSRRNDAPERASRPFDVARDGFVLGEGAGVLVLERAEHAAARGVRPLGVVAGHAATTDAHHPTQPAPDGRGAARALRLALRDADLAPDDVDHVNAHGTSTPANDAAEAVALRGALGGALEGVSVTSTKSAIGHTFGAAGAIEAVVCVRSLAEQRVHPTQNLEDLDPACRLDVVHGAPREGSLRVIASNAFGFGGHNAVLVFRRP